MDGIPTRPMRVKILYTFDHGNSVNHLARLPDVLQIPAVPIDENTMVGVIDLQKCLGALVAASPELVSRLTDGDFTVYAYDYSEPDAPLVGQGMLSTALAAEEEQDSQSMITGRVCQAALAGLFNSGVKETLEVKLRLVPVARAPQQPTDDHVAFSGGVRRGSDSGIIDNTFARSDGSPSAHQRQASLPLAYNEDSQARKRVKVTQTDWHGRSSFGSKSSDLRVTAATAASMHMHRPIPKRPSAPGSNLEPPPRVPTPVPDMKTLPTQQMPSQMPPPRRSLLRQASSNWDTLSDAEYFSDAVASSPEDDSPSNSLMAGGSPDCLPQDIPSSPPVFPDMQLPQPSSPGLPTLPPPRLADSGYMSERGWNSSNPIESVEQDGSVADYQDRFGFHQQTARATSKKGKSRAVALTSDISINLETPGDMNQLPQKMLLNLPPGRREGSQGPRPSTSKKTAKSSAGSPTDDFQAPSEWSSRVGSPVPANSQPRPQLQSSTSFSHPPQQVPTKAPSEAPGSRRGSLALPPRLHTQTSDLPDSQSNDSNTSKKRHSLARTRTSSNDSEMGSPAPSDTEGRPRGPSRSGSGAQRRKAIEAKLQKSLEMGVMPTYCSHCGAIETPTWRRLYAKTFDGKPSPLDYQEGEGETVGVETATTDDNGEVTSFIIRKAMKKTKDSTPGAGFKEVIVCNPCGLWFNKTKTMRPADKWKKTVGSRKSKKTKGGDTDLMTDGLEPQSDMLFTDQPMPEGLLDDIDQSVFEPEPVDSFQPRPAARGARASSMQPQTSRRANSGNALNASQLDAALTRAVQSSPARFGSQESPIEIEEMSAKPTRRLLFPSPRKDGEVKSLDDNGQASLMATTPSKMSGLHDAFANIKPGFDFDHMDSNVFDAFTSLDKENIAPPISFDQVEDLEQLMGESPSALFRTPRKANSKASVTPKSTRQSKRLLEQTPVTGSRKRRALAENPNAANNATLTNDFMTSPSSSRYFLRSTPSRLDRTPGRSSGAGQNVNNEMTPWSRQIADMLSGNGDPDAEPFTSPSRAFDLSGLPAFGTPGRVALDDYDWGKLDDMMSSEFALFSNQDSDGNLKYNEKSD